MGLFGFLTGRKSPLAGVVRQDAATLRAALLAVARDSAPFTVRDGGREGCDLLAEWRIVDAAWYEVFAKAGISKVSQVLMRIDAVAGQVRSVDRDFSVAWRAGVPSLTLAAAGFRGQQVGMSFGAAYAFREDDLRFGKVYQYRFNSAEMKGPLQAAALAAGWGWKPVAFGRL